MSIEGSSQGNITAGAFTEKSVGNIFVGGHENEILLQVQSPDYLAARSAERPTHRVARSPTLQYFKSIR